MKAQRISNPLNRRLYSITEIAHYLGRSSWTVAEMVRSGRLPYIPDGKRKLLDIRDIDRWIEANRTRAID